MLVSATSILSIPLLFTSLASAITWDCTHVRADGVKFNFEKLAGPHSVTVMDEDRPPSVYNTTWTVDICNALVRRNDINKTDQCPQGTFVCGVVSSYKKEDDSDEHGPFQVAEVIPIAGNFQTSDGKGLEPQFERLKKQDAKSEGLELELNGGTYDKRKQKAIIKLICDKDRTGNEGKISPPSSLERRADEKDGDQPDSKNSLSYVSYGSEDNMDVLRLSWRSQYACEDSALEGGDKKGGWGFFTWLIVILFLGIAAYLIFGSWLNYNRYGARGWDLLPHGDTIRDIPYLFKDWSRKVVDTVSGGGSRGGYSAV